MSMSNQTCDLNSFPSFESLPVPQDITVGGLSRSNETLIAMQQCCTPNPVNSVGDCVLWCEIPDDTTKEQWGACTRQFIHDSHITVFHSEGTTATPARPTMLGVAAVTLLISGIFAW